jgi:hypothetical protein
MYTLLNNIIFDIFQYVIVCVDFLETYIASLVLFFKTGCDNYIIGQREYVYILTQDIIRIMQMSISRELQKTPSGYLDPQELHRDNL